MTSIKGPEADFLAGEEFQIFSKGYGTPATIATQHPFSAVWIEVKHLKSSICMGKQSYEAIWAHP